MEPAVHSDWSGLPGDLIAMVMSALGIPDMFSAGAVCKSWHAAFCAVRRDRVLIKDASPCLLYSCDTDDTATIYSPSAGAAFKVRLPGPAFRSRYVIGSGHGWIVAADEESNLQVLNPLTGAQIDLPPVTGLYHVKSSFDDKGCPVYHLLGQHANKLFDQGMDPDTPDVYTLRELQLLLYERAYLSCSPSAGDECIILLVHRDNGEMSFARVGDSRWTRVTWNKTVPYSNGCRAAAYSKKDGLFYILYTDRSIYTLDLNGALPVARKIVESEDLWEGPSSYNILAPWGDILNVSRFTEPRTQDTPVQIPAEYAQEVIGPFGECYTDKIKLYKVDTLNRKLVEICSSDLQGHALFLGFNSPMLVSTKDFPNLKSNCPYITEDAWEHICVNMFGSGEVGIWDFKTETLGRLDGDVLSTQPWLDWPPSIWITPSLV